MPRANRHFIPNQVWHLTQRCHKKQWLLKFNKDKRAWMYWLFESRRRYGLSVLNYVVTSNHIHLLVFDQGRGEIARSMQLIAGRTGQEYNNRKQRLGSFWQDRYHATAVESDSHLQQCLTYIDLNMVRAGVVEHPVMWATMETAINRRTTAVTRDRDSRGARRMSPFNAIQSGYAEIQSPRERYGRIDYARLLELMGLQSTTELQLSREIAIAEALQECRLQRNPIWTESVAVGSEQYLAQIKEKLKIRQPGRRLVEVAGERCLRERTFPLYRIFEAQNGL